MPASSVTPKLRSRPGRHWRSTKPVPTAGEGGARERSRREPSGWHVLEVLAERDRAAGSYYDALWTRSAISREPSLRRCAVRAPQAQREDRKSQQRACGELEKGCPGRCLSKTRRARRSSRTWTLGSSSARAESTEARAKWWYEVHRMGTAAANPAVGSVETSSPPSSRERRRTPRICRPSRRRSVPPSSPTEGRTRAALRPSAAGPSSWPPRPHASAPGPAPFRAPPQPAGLEPPAPPRLIPPHANGPPRKPKPPRGWDPPPKIAHRPQREHRVRSMAQVLHADVGG